MDTIQKIQKRFEEFADSERFDLTRLPESCDLYLSRETRIAWHFWLQGYSTGINQKSQSQEYALEGK